MKVKSVENRFEDAYDFARFMGLIAGLKGHILSDEDFNKIPKAARSCGVTQGEGYDWADKLLKESPRTFLWRIDDGDGCSPDELVVTEILPEDIGERTP